MRGVRCVSAPDLPRDSFLINVLLLFCSDVEIHHLEKAQRLKFTNVKVVASGPLRASVVTDVEYGKSKITTTVSTNPT